ncbi:MAG: ribonuclease R [Clostridia bacterium]|nr:ribonuclease R [Clostridia bacterium]
MSYKKYYAQRRGKKPAKTDGKNKITFTGTLRANEKGFAFITPDDKEKYKKDFFVPKRAVNGALDGDRVLASPVKGTADEASVLSVLERGRKKIVGTIERAKTFCRLYPDDNKMPEVAIPLALCMNAKDGDKVLCEITAYPKKSYPKGKVIEILGESGDFEVEELSIIRAYGLYENFPEDVLAEAKRVSEENIVLGNRKDLRDKLIFTIDGADTRDIDDGVSLEVVGGNYLLGVHIADVSHYVKPRTPLDNEAYARGTSVYFPDRVLPMLPKDLSNGACSLNEGEDRYALSCLMTFDKNGKRLNSEICESVIRSRHKMTYPAVTAICGGDKEACAAYPDLVDTVKQMEKLCLIMEGNRDAAGSVTLDVREAKIYIDGDEIVIPDYNRTISERIIEQFMISANEAVAEFLLKCKAPCMYRVHEVPSPEKASLLLSFVKDLGITARCNAESVAPKDFQHILKAAEGKPFYSVINKVMLRSMQKARYSASNLGHFGLASQCYCHFTSPIRRYPDLFVHRSLKEVLRGNKEKAVKLYGSVCEGAAADCSDRERIADEAERAVDDLYKLVYMSDRIGECFDAVISGVTNFGVFCELENTIEGLIPLEVLPDEKYEYFAEKFLLKGKKHSFRLGEKIKIRVDGCDFGKMRVMFSLND